MGWIGVVEEADGRVLRIGSHDESEIYIIAILF